MKRSTAPSRLTLPRAWATWVDTGSAAVIRASHNVSSVTRNSSGNYTVSWARPFGYAAGATGYAVVGSCRVSAAVGGMQIDPTDGVTGAYTNTLTRVITGAIGTGVADADVATIAAWGP